MSTETIVRCDVEGCGAVDAKPRSLDVVFLTEQTEGRSIAPKVTRTTLDMCEGCVTYSAENRELLSARGAMGNNRFWFKSKA